MIHVLRLIPGTVTVKRNLFTCRYSLKPITCNIQNVVSQYKYIHNLYVHGKLTVRYPVHGMFHCFVCFHMYNYSLLRKGIVNVLRILNYYFFNTYNTPSACGRYTRSGRNLSRKNKHIAPNANQTQ